MTAGAQTAGARHVISVVPGSAKETGVVYAQPVPMCMSMPDMRKTPYMCRRTCPVNGAGIADGKERHINLNPFFTGPAPIKIINMKTDVFIKRSLNWLETFRVQEHKKL